MSQPSHPPNPPDPPQSVEDEARQHIAIRVEELQNKLRSTNDPAQAANISAALNIYSKGEIPGGSKYALTYFQGGRIVDSPSKIDFLGPWLIEVRSTVCSAVVCCY